MKKELVKIIRKLQQIDVYDIEQFHIDDVIQSVRDIMDGLEKEKAVSEPTLLSRIKEVGSLEVYEINSKSFYVENLERKFQHGILYYDEAPIIEVKLEGKKVEFLHDYEWHNLGHSIVRNNLFSEILEYNEIDTTTKLLKALEEGSFRDSEGVEIEIS